MMRALFVFLMVAISPSIYAGYYAQVTAITGGTLSNTQAGQTTACYLTPSMAVSVVPNFAGCGWQLLAMDADGNWQARVNPAACPSYSGPVVTGTYSQCVTSPLVAALPSFLGGVSDPAISGGSVLSGSSGGGGSTADAETIAALQSTVASLQAAITATGANVTNLQGGMQSLLNAAAATFDPVFAFAAFSFFYVGVITFWAITKGAGVILDVLRRRGIV